MTSTPRFILGISAFYHDSAACLLRDGEIVAAASGGAVHAQEARRRTSRTTPSRTACARRASRSADLDYVGFYDKPLLKFERILETYLGVAPRGFRSFLMAGAALAQGEALHRRRSSATRSAATRATLLYAEHHESHAASAFFPSPFEEAAILTMDGVGEWATASLRRRPRQRHRAARRSCTGPTRSACSTRPSPTTPASRSTPASTRSWASRPYGEPKYVDLIYEQLIDLKDDGSFRLNQEYFNYLTGLTMTNERVRRAVRRAAARARDAS